MEIAVYSAHRADCVSPPSVRPSSSLGAAMPPFIDPSLARGIRRGYLLALDEAWDRWRHAKTAAIRRNGHLEMPNGKAFQKICAREEKLAKAFLPVDGVTLRSGRRRLWAMLTLKREVEAKAAGDVRWRGMSEAGRARLVGRVLTYPANSVEHTMPVCFSGHAIDRVIQRA